MPESKGAQTISVTCNRNSPLQRAAHLAIVTEVGPEVISGSTRMKAGTAQKMVLNMLSSGAMTRLGYVYGNLMVNVTPRNSKLAARGVSILQQAAGVSADDCQQGFAGGGKQRAGGAGDAAGGSGPPGSGAGAEIGWRACAAGDRCGAESVDVAPASRRPSCGRPARACEGKMPSRQPARRRRYETSTLPYRPCTPE